jgi:acetyl esterase/lipase
VASDPRAVLTRPAPAPDASVPYGPLPEQVLDVRLPPPGGRDAGRPLVVVVHGGFWRAEYDRAHVGPLATALAAHGWPVAVVEYRRTGQPGGGWPGTFDDVAAAIGRAPAAVADALADHRPPAGAVLLGHSAGGQLALWYAAAARPKVRAVVALAPVADLGRAYALGLDGGAVADLLGGGPNDVPDRYAAVDPALRPALGVPTLLLHGDRDLEVPLELSRRYAERARAAGATVTLTELPGVEHFGLIDPESTAWASVTSALRSTD